MPSGGVDVSFGGGRPGARNPLDHLARVRAGRARHFLLEYDTFHFLEAGEVDQGSLGGVVVVLGQQLRKFRTACTFLVSVHGMIMVCSSLQF